MVSATRNEMRAAGGQDGSRERVWLRAGGGVGGVRRAAQGDGGMAKLRDRSASNLPSFDVRLDNGARFVLSLPPIPLQL